MRVTLNSMDPELMLLLEELRQNKAKKDKGEALDDILQPNIPKNAQLQPDWNRIPSKNVKMTEEEFEEAIRALAFADADRGMKMGNAGKGIQAGAMQYSKLQIEYISVVSPDRKAAYENFNGKGDTIKGNFNQTLMTRNSDGVWVSEYLTKEEMARYSKFGGIYINAINEYEAEHGKLPYVEDKKSAPNSYWYSQWAAYNPSAYPSLYNVLA